jgi:hypothetical protein
MAPHPSKKEGGFEKRDRKAKDFWREYRKA